jgi:hypothetical protein
MSVNKNRVLELDGHTSGRAVRVSVLTASLAELIFITATILPETAAAHAIAGDRIFPATLAIDDPSVSSEISFPTVDWFPTSRDAGGDVSKQTDVGGELDLLFAPDFAIGVSDTWTTVTASHQAGRYGFQNLQVSAKYKFYENDDHEILMSVGLKAEGGNTGAARLGADSTSTFTPTFYFGKGFGDLPDSMALLMPLAITGTMGLAVPQSRSGSNVFQPGISIQYSMPYLKSSVKDYDLPEFVNHLIPLVEAPLEIGLDDSDHSFGGTINPGFIYMGNTWQLGIEAMIPVSADTQHGTGVIAQFHIFLDSFPAFAQPVFGESR